MSAPKRWAIMSKFVVPRLDDEGDYLTRWRIITTPFGGIFLHRIEAPDSRPVLHDHPWSFVALVLRGGYDEVRLDLHSRLTFVRSINRINVMRRDDYHYIARLHKGTTWTLLFVGARRRKWGYLRPNDSGAQWTPFDTDEMAVAFDAAMERRKR